jgi:electron transfer flavoprotein beta subunit
MDMLVCVKRVPDTADAEIALRPDGLGVREADLAFGPGEWDLCAVEEAIRLKERHGGSVTVATIGPQESEEVLRRGLAMGADAAVRIDGTALGDADPYGIAGALAGFARPRHFDLVLLGALAGDDGYGMTGPILAAALERPHATLVNAVEVEGTSVVVARELEGGLEELLALELPAVLTIQTGINEPRYVSIMGIRKVRGKEIPVLAPADLGGDAGATGIPAPVLRSLGLALPPAGQDAVFLKGSPAEVAQRILEIVRERGGMA